MTRGQRVLVPALALLVGACDGCGSRDDGKEIWRFAIEEPRGSVQDRYAQRFAELIEERTQGRVEVKVYPYGTLGTSDHLTEQLHGGTIEFVMASPGHLGKLIPEVQVFLLHFVLSDDEEVNKVVLRDTEALRERFNDIYSRKGLHFLSAFSEGWMVWTADKPIREPADFDGVKFRVMTSPLLLAAYDAYGASATPLPYSEVYSGLQLGMIDGQVNPVFAIWEMSFYEVTDYMIFPRHAPFITTVVTGERFFGDLSPTDREMVERTVTDLQDYVFEVQRDLNAERLDKIRERKPSIEIIDLTQAERAKFREVSLPVREQYLRLAGPQGRDILELLLEAVEETERRLEAEPR